jgi:hypothetical protein
MVAPKPPHPSPAQTRRPIPLRSGQAPPWTHEIKVRLARLEGALSATRRNAHRWRLAFWSVAAAFVVTAGFVGAVITSSTLTFAGIHGEVDKYDEDSFITSATGVDVNPIAVSVSGNTAQSAAELTSAIGLANTDLAEGDWFYSATVKEATAAAVSSGTFQVGLYVDGAPQGFLYMTQGTGDNSLIEGVTFKWNLGQTLNSQSAYVVKVLQV